MADLPPPTSSAVISARDVALYVETYEGGTDSVIAIHGGPGISHDHLRTLAPLTSAGVDLVLYDQRGTGRSSPPLDPRAYHFEQYIADLEVVRASTGDPAVVLIGHSWGTLVAAAYAAKHPERVSALVIIDPISPTAAGLHASWSSLGHRVDQLTHLGVIKPAPMDGDDCTAMFLAELPAYNADPFAPIAADGAAGTCRYGPRVRTWAAVGTYDLRATLTRITSPVLVVAGRMDPYGDVPAEWAENLRAPHEVAYLDGCGHRPMHECAPELLALVEAYVTR